VTGAGSGSTSVSDTRLQRLEIGSLPFDNLHAEVIDLSRIQRAIGFPRLDGIIGYDILRRLEPDVFRPLPPFDSAQGDTLP
jgi:hypothetical protein